MIVTILLLTPICRDIKLLPSYPEESPEWNSAGDDDLAYDACENFFGDERCCRTFGIDPGVRESSTHCYGYWYYDK